MKAPMPAMDRQYQAEDDHRTLTRAAEIQANRPRMAAVRRHHRKMTTALGKMDRMLSRKR
jgi:hypothetical protein